MSYLKKYYMWFKNKSAALNILIPIMLKHGVLFFSRNLWGFTGNHDAEITSWMYIIICSGKKKKKTKMENYQNYFHFKHARLSFSLICALQILKV
jgi:hypothetical protein